MNPSIQHPEPNGICQPSGDSSQSEATLSTLRNQSWPFLWVALLAGLLFLFFSAPAARADRSPPGCLGSGLGISLYTSLPDVHIGDTIYYSVNVFNTPFPACDAGFTNPAVAGAIRAFVVTPDGVTNNLTLRRTFLAPGDSDFYTNIVSYVVRAQDILPDGTVRATAVDQGDIHQNDTNSRGGGNQGVNTEVNEPCVKITAQCVGSVGENGAITFSGTVTNCGNNTLVGVTVTNIHDGGSFTVLFPTNLAIGQIAPFSGSWVPLNPCLPSTATLTVLATDQFTSTPRTVTSFTTVTCQNTLTPGIKVTKSCPAQPVAPGQLLTFSGSVSNTGNVTLTNIVVVNDQPAPNTPVFTLASLAPGASANFTSAATVPANACSVTGTFRGIGRDICTSTTVTNTVSTTCPITTAPAIAVTLACPAVSASTGGLISYTGTVRNSGNVALNNVFVVNNQPAPNTPVIGPLTLAPGAVSNFTASFTAPADACSVSSTVTASGSDACTAALVSNSASATCTLITAPNIAITQNCPPNPIPIGSVYRFSGFVTNSGDAILTNVVVFSSQAGQNLLLLGPLDLAPGESKVFTGSYTVTANSNPETDTVTARGSDVCQGRTFSIIANCSGPVSPLTITSITSVTVANGMSTVTWTATPGVTYRLQCGSSAQNSVWTNVPGDVTASGATASKNDAVG